MCCKWCKMRTKSQWFAIIIIILFVFVSYYFVYQPLAEWDKANNELIQPREYNLTLGNVMNIVKGEERYNITWQIDLSIHQPHTTLTTGDRVDISGIAYAETPPNFEIIDLSVWFQMSEPYNLTVDNNDMLNYNGSTVHLNIPDSNKLIGNASIKWELEGSYHPVGQILFENETGRYDQYLGISPEIAITVYPKSEYAQTVNNNVTMILTGAVYVLTLVGTGDLIVHLWDRKEGCEDSDNDSENNESAPQKENKIRDKGVVERADNENSLSKQ